MVFILSNFLYGNGIKDAESKIYTFEWKYYGKVKESKKDKAFKDQILKKLDRITDELYRKVNSELEKVDDINKRR